MLFLAKIMIVYFIAINTITFAAFYLDKKAAAAHSRRVSEKALLLMAFLGGSPLAIVAMKKFRHKTIKQPFKSILLAIIGLQAIALIAALYFLSKTFKTF